MGSTNLLIPLEGTFAEALVSVHMKKIIFNYDRLVQRLEVDSRETKEVTITLMRSEH